ncbi:5-oxoprolinase subunit PxpA [Propioniciclava sp.]|uniref:LamB/YcsF family protein n=1 Tax=Propioniciclava sp. TaxID=2038686 RepID=UPI00260F1DC4|nr:5-oxoprolinase subunit PxpA [Propioniciclava sp.]
MDLNADSGEAIGDDAAMMAVVTSASVACGYHAGDADTMRATVAAAAAHEVAVGAHVSYADRARFGRVFIDLPPSQLHRAVLDQFAALVAVAAESGAEVRYCKPHGALYNAIVHHEQQADAVAAALAEVLPELPVLCLPHSAIERAATARGLRPVIEAFADRAYAPDGTLVPRSRPGSVLTDAAAIAARVVRLATDGVLEAVDGSPVRIPAESICVHGDTPGAVAIARAVRVALQAAGVELAPFA